MSTQNFEPTEADLEEAYRMNVLQQTCRIIAEHEALLYEGSIHGLKLKEAPDETE